GLPVISTYMPTGTFTFIPPRDANNQPRRYTIAQIFDIINEGLLAGPQAQQYMLIRREQSFALVPANADIPEVMLRRVSPEDLGEHGQTDVVKMELPLKTLKARDVAPEVRKMLGPFGRVVLRGQTNVLYLQDTAANLRRIHTTVSAMDTQAPRKRQ